MQSENRIRCITGHIVPSMSLTNTTFAESNNVSRTLSKHAMRATQRNDFQMFRIDGSSIKPYLNVCFVGHDDSGKSTIVDQLQLSLKPLKTPKYDLNVVSSDNKDLIRDMVAGTAEPDVAVVIVSCATNEFESAISGGTLTDQIAAAGVLGCNKVIVCVNKVDTVTEEVRLARYAEVASKMKTLVSNNHPVKDPIIIPISGNDGTGLIEASGKYGWFKGFTPAKDPKVKISSLEAALNYQTEPKRDYKKPMRMLITSRRNIPGVGSVFSGRVCAGVIKHGMKVQIQPHAIDANVKTIEIHGKPQTGVLCGQVCGVAFNRLEEVNKIKPGSIISEAGETALKMAYGAVVKILITDHEGTLKPGYSPILFLPGMRVSARLAKFISKKAGGTPLIENPDTITKGDEVIAIMVPKISIAFERMADCASLGIFALTNRSGRIVGVGSIQEKLSKEDLQSKYGVD